MPTGPKHFRWYDTLVDGVAERHEEVCRCMIGNDHDDSQSLSEWDAADIWQSSGQDEDYTFGYDAGTLRRASKD